MQETYFLQKMNNKKKQNKIKIICLTPIKNEAWILDRFLLSASIWADYIIIADQNSSDASREIAKRYPKVILINNSSLNFNEPERQKMLIEEARKISGPKILITLDADEIFTPNCGWSEDWQKMLESPPGTVFKFFWENLCAGMKEKWTTGPFAWGFMDDNKTMHSGNKIHSPRIPLPENYHSLILKDLKVMHLQYTNQERMQSKHRWYQCYEKIQFPQKNPVEIFRKYHHMYGIPKKDLRPIPTSWVNDYKKKGIHLDVREKEKIFYWDKKIQEYFSEYDTGLFRKLNIWNVHYLNFKNPQNILDKIALFYLSTTQKFSKNIIIVILDKILAKFWK
jgi:hypothetical protein